MQRHEFRNLEWDLYSEIQVFQKELAQDLETKYEKAFNDTKMTWPDSQNRFDRKKEIVHKLHAICFVDIKTFAQLAYFIFLYNTAYQDNLKIDPKGITDKLRKKPEGGQLGKILSSHLNIINSFKLALEQAVAFTRATLETRMPMLNAYFSMGEERKETSEMPASQQTYHLLKIKHTPQQTYHLLKIKHIIDGSKNIKLPADVLEDLQNMLGEENKWLCERLTNLSEFEQFREEYKKQMLFFQLMRIDSTFINCEFDFLNCNAKDITFSICILELINVFFETLFREEKKYFWELTHKALALDWSKTKANDLDIFKEELENLLTILQNYYMEDSYSQLMLNAKLAEDIKGVKVLKVPILNIIDEMTTLCLYHLRIRTERIRTLSQNNIIFEILSELDKGKYEWSKRLENLNKQFIDGLYKIKDLVNNLERDPQFIVEDANEQCLVSLITHAMTVANEITEFKQHKKAEVGNEKRHLAIKKAGIESFFCKGGICYRVKEAASHLFFYPRDEDNNFPVDDDFPEKEKNRYGTGL